MSQQEEDATYGWTPLPADQSLDRPATSSPRPVTLQELEIPDTALVRRIEAYAKSKLSPQTFAHSHRVYLYGRAIASQCFPSWHLEPGSSLDETWYLTAMLHDIGTADEYIHSTRLSFEFWGGYHALQLLQDSTLTTESVQGFQTDNQPAEANGVAGRSEASETAPRAQAESVAEAIIRHQDIQPHGRVTLMTRLIHLGTLLDNIGASAELVHLDTIRSVTQAWDRKGWAGCFERTVSKEKDRKPWTMVSRIEGFEGKIAEHGERIND